MRRSQCRCDQASGLWCRACLARVQRLAVRAQRQRDRERARWGIDAAVSLVAALRYARADARMEHEDLLELRAAALAGRKGRRLPRDTRKGILLETASAAAVLETARRIVSKRRAKQ